LISECSFDLSFVWVLSESRDRLFCLELIFSFSFDFFSDICRTIFFSTDGAGLESSSRITQIGDGGWTDVDFSGSFGRVTDPSGVGDNWTIGGVDCGAAWERKDN
jgi:hypothetical protein